MAKTILHVDIAYDPELTDPEGLATAMDRLLETALSTPGIFEEYGNPRVGEFLVAEVSGNSPQPPSRVIVQIVGGVLQEAHSSDPAVQLMLLDWDSEASDAGPGRGVVEIRGRNRRTTYALVAEFPTLPLEQLRDTDAAAALDKAGIAWQPGGDERHLRWHPAVVHPIRHGVDGAGTSRDTRGRGGFRTDFL